MCEKAVEIQKSHNQRHGDWQYDKDQKKIFSGAYMSNIAYLEPCYPMEIWLPRQDQLQDMIVTLGMSSATFLQTMANKVWDSMQSCDYYLQFKSMEQLWLGFIMFEKYNKKWNGKDWR